METNQKCCDVCKVSGDFKGEEYCVHPYCACHKVEVEYKNGIPVRANGIELHHPQEEKEWEKEFERDFGDCQDIGPETFKEFIQQQKHLSYQAGLKFAMGKVEGMKHTDCGCDIQCKNEVLEDITQSLTSELDKEVN